MIKFTSRHVIAILILCCGMTITAKAQYKNTPSDSISVHDAIHLALKNQPQLQEIQSQVEEAKAQVGQAQSSRLPQLDVQGHAIHIHPVSKFQLDPNEPAQALEPENSINAHFAARQLIYDFGKTEANIDLARSKTLSAQQQMQVKKWTISYFTVKTYYSILYVQSRIKVQQKQLKALREDSTLAQKRLDNGSATKYDVLSIKVRIAEKRNQRLDLINQEHKMKIRLRRLFGWSSDRTVKLSGNLNLTSNKPMINPGQVSYHERPDYQVLQQKKKVAQSEYELRKTGNNPVISAIGTAGYKDGYIKNLDRLYRNWSLGVNVNIPIFHGHETDYKEQEAQAHLHTIKAQTLQLQRKIDSQLQQAYSDVQTNEKKLSAADLQIKQAKEQLRLAKLRYRKGVVTNTELLNSETALAQARLQKATDKYHILLSQYQLKKAAGKNIWSMSSL